MRKSSVEDCIKVLKHFGIDPSQGEAIDVGGTDVVYLDNGFAPNPLLEISPNLTFLDKGFNVKRTGGIVDMLIDFLDAEAITHLKGRFDLVYCFDTLEHVSNPFLFCEHLIDITKPGGYIYVSTVFEWPYHPSPDDYFRFSPDGLKELFCNIANRHHAEVKVIWCGWETDRNKVSLLAQRQPELSSAMREPRPSAAATVEGLLVSEREYSIGKGVERFTQKVWRFLQKPWPEKCRSFRFIVKHAWFTVTSYLPHPVRLPYGVWILTWHDVMGENIRRGEFEEGERRFVERFLRPGQVVFDIGSHIGFYTLLAAKLVGKTGRVVAFEPSARERHRLRLNLLLNRCHNVCIVPYALGNSEGTAELYVCLGRETGCNSLRPPVVNEPVSKVQVPITTLDHHVEKTGIGKVDFVKMDVEGAELHVLDGAKKLLRNKPRPVLMYEAADIRTSAWGYPAKEIYDFLHDREYRIFSVLADGRLFTCPRKDTYHENLIAVPVERLAEVEGHVWKRRH
ncbi:MAG: FkbM family methyltransferase [Candidatus Methanomethyliaceae archaeon]